MSTPSLKTKFLTKVDNCLIRRYILHYILLPSWMRPKKKRVEHFPLKMFLDLCNCVFCGSLLKKTKTNFRNDTLYVFCQIEFMSISYRMTLILSFYIFFKEDKRKFVNIIHCRIKSSMYECTERTKMMWMQRLGKLSASTYNS